MNGPHRVVYSEAVRNSLKELLTQAARRDAETGKRALEAVKAIDHHLHEEPQIFGEPCFHARQMKLTVRIGAVLPLAVSFAVHDDHPLVFVTGFRLLG